MYQAEFAIELMWCDNCREQVDTSGKLTTAKLQEMYEFLESHKGHVIACHAIINDPDQMAENIKHLTVN